MVRTKFDNKTLSYRANLAYLACTVNHFSRHLDYVLIRPSYGQAILFQCWYHALDRITTERERQFAATMC